jgi:hypothetical protein
MELLVTAWNGLKWLEGRSRKLLYDWWSVGQSVSMSWFEHACGTCDQILLPVGMLLFEICGLVYVRRPL